MTLILSTVGAPRPLPTKVSHPAHPEHELELAPTGQDKFECNGCHEHGTGDQRYTCEPCHFDLHTACAVAEGTLMHEVPRSTFKLRLDAPRSRERCSACGDHAKGIHYYCEEKDLYLHPCCAQLPLKIRLELDDELYFELREEVRHCCTKCGKGGGLRDFWFYRSSCKTMYLHVRCIKEFFLLPSSGAEGSSVVDDEGKLTGYVKETAKSGSGKGGKSFDGLSEILKAVVSIILAVITGNPIPVIAAAVDLGVNLTRLTIRE